MKLTEVTLPCLQPEDREQFILDNQWAFKYGAQQEFGMRDERCEEGEEVISRSSSIVPNFATTFVVLFPSWVRNPLME